MSLSDAMLQIADNIEEDSKKLQAQDVSLGMLVLSYARQIRAAVTAAEASQTCREKTPSRQEIELLKMAGEREEKIHPGIAQFVGGNLDGDYMPVDPSVPVGAKTIAAGQVYVLGDGWKLNFSQEETDKAVKSKAEQAGKNLNANPPSDGLILAS